jgi:pilus assembly protein CpaE
MARVLVVDDDSEYLEMINLLLERDGHQTVLSADGRDGLAKALADPPDLAILDVMMPGITGYEVCRQLRGNPATSAIPIIILTARGQPVDRDAALDAGADAHMSKPVTMSELSELITTLLAKRVTVRAPSLEGVVALLSLRGGVGVTTLAVNLAAALTQAGDASVCLVDLCPSSGHAALQLRLKPDPNWSGLARTGGVDAPLVASHLLKHDTDLRLLASPVFPVTGSQDMSRSVAQTVLNTLRQRFSTVVVDAPSVLSEAAMAAVEAAAVIGLVITAESASIQTAVGTLRALKDWFDKFRIILNHVAPGPETPTEPLERTLKRPVVATVPFDPAQAQALAHGEPLILHNPGSPLAQAVKELAEGLLRSADAGR